MKGTIVRIVGLINTPMKKMLNLRLLIIKCKDRIIRISQANLMKIIKGIFKKVLVCRIIARIKKIQLANLL